MVDPRDQAHGSPGDTLPDSGDGVTRPAPSALPHPALWAEPAPDEQPKAWHGKKEDDADIPPRTPARQATIYGSVVVMVVAAALVGVAFTRQSLVLGAVGVVLGLSALVVALKAGILLAVSVGESPTGPG